MLSNLVAKIISENVIINSANSYHDVNNYCEEKNRRSNLIVYEQ